MCTRKVLTLERLDGNPVREHTAKLLEVFAEHRGMDLAELKTLLRKPPAEIEKNNPELMQQLLCMKPVSEAAAESMIAAVKVRDTASRWLWKCSCCAGPPPPSKEKKKEVPLLNGPRISKILFEVHGHQIFHNGLFNSDPHAGNVLYLKDGRLGLVDYGAVLRLSREMQSNLARLIISIAEEDDDATPHLMFECGFRSAKMDHRLALLMAHVCFNRGPHPDDLNRLAPKVGMPANPSLQTLDEFVQGGKLDEIEDFPTHLLMLQRCAMVLSGIGMELGAGRMSSAGMLKPQAVLWLQSQDESLR